MSRPGRALGFFSFLVYLFLYAPLFVLAVFSFNRSRLTASWDGLTLDWYARLWRDAQILGGLRNSLVVGVIATAITTVVGTAAALAFHRHRFRREATWEGLITLPMVVPEIVLATSFLLLFVALGLRLGFLTLVLAHVGFSVSYAVLVVRARLAGFDRALEEAAMDLGAGPYATFFKVTLPAIAPGVLAAALLVFALSIDDYLVSSFVAGVGSTTLPIQIYSMVKSGISPEINAVSTLLLLATSALLYAAYRLEQGAAARQVAGPAALGLLVLAAPFAFAPPAGGGEKSLNVYIWSEYIAQETVEKFERRHGVHVNVDLFDSEEALLAKVQVGAVAYDVICPTNYAVQILRSQGLLRRLDRSALPHFANLEPRFLNRSDDPGDQYSVPYLWATCGIGYRKSKVPKPDSWNALWDARYAGRILMLDDPRETMGAALKLLGRSANSTDPEVLRAAQRMLLDQKRLVGSYDSGSFDLKLLAGDVWMAQGWSGQFAKVGAKDGDIGYVIPKEGTTTYVDTLAIPARAPHPELAHAFLDFTLEAEIAAEICRTMRYPTPNRAAMALLPPEIRDDPVAFPPPEELARTEFLVDLGEATQLYDRLWTEVKSAR
jgi:spermidine/putrescine transport system permease protein